MKFKISLLLVSVVLLNACASTRPCNPTVAETNAAARSVSVLNDAPSQYSVPSANTSSRKMAHQAPAVVSGRITAQDVLNVNVFEVPNLSATGLIVEAGGAISLPLVGSMQVSGLTISQAEQKIKQRLTEFMQEPKVSITRTNKAVEKRVTVEGAVTRPGVFPIRGNLSFLQAIALSQGLTELADSRKVFFYRDGKQYVVNLDLVRTGRISDPILRGDDRIVVLKDNVKVRERKVLEYIPAVLAPFSVLSGF